MPSIQQPYSTLRISTWPQHPCSRCRLRFLNPLYSHSTAYLSSRPPRDQHMMQRYLEDARTKLHTVLQQLRSHSSRLSGEIAARVDRFGTQVNHVTGYEDIDKLKLLVQQKEEQLKTAREAARSLKTAYDQAVATRATAQRSVNSLLERKDRWSDADVADFTSLIRSDHASNNAVSQTSLQLDAAEADVDRVFSELTNSILSRYHEEQIWSDKIRSFSTHANLVGLIVNLVVFVGAIAFVEPWKRRKLAEGLESRMSEMMGDVQAQIGILAEETRRTVTSQMLNAGDIPIDHSTEPHVANESALLQENTPDSETASEIPPPQAPLQTLLGTYYRYVDFNSTPIESSYLMGLTGVALGMGLASVFQLGR